MSIVLDQPIASIPPVPPAACIAGRQIWVRVLSETGERRECGKIVGFDNETGKYEVFADHFVTREVADQGYIATHGLRAFISPCHLVLLNPDGFELARLDGSPNA